MRENRKVNININGKQIIALSAVLAVTIVVGIPVNYLLFKLEPQGRTILTWGLVVLLSIVVIMSMVALLIKVSVGQMMSVLNQDHYQDMDMMGMFREMRQQNRELGVMTRSLMRQGEHDQHQLPGPNHPSQFVQQPYDALDSIYDEVTVGE